MKPEIRTLTEKDSTALFEFYTTLSEAVTSYFLPFPDSTIKFFLKHLKESEAGDHISSGVIGDDGKILGHGFILYANTDQPVFGVGLNEHFHGRGLGHKLAEFVLGPLKNLLTGMI